MKRPRQHNERHLAFVRTLPCCLCGDNTSAEPAHIRMSSRFYGKRPTGMAEKPDDRWVTPLCSKCHREQHTGNEREFWFRRGIDPFALALSLYGATEDAETAEMIIREQTYGDGGL